MKTIFKGAALLLGIFLAASMLLAQTELKKEGKHWIGEDLKTFAADTGGTLLMEDIQGDVTIRTWNKNEVSIRETKKFRVFSKEKAEKTMKECETEYSKTGNTVSVIGYPDNPDWIDYEYNVMVPIRFTCNVSTGGGDISLEGLDGPFEASSGGGDITITSTRGPVDCQTGGGDITVTDVKNRLDCQTGGGNITITRGLDEIHASTGGGDIEILQGTGPIELQTGGGNIVIEKPKNRIRVGTGGGDVTISGSTASLVPVDVTTGGGEIIISDITGDIDLRTGGGEIRITNIIGNFSANTGGGTVEGKKLKGKVMVKTGGGEIRVTDIQGPIDFATGGGDVTAELTLVDFKKAHSVSITTGGGNIELSIPSKTPASVDAEIRYRDREWEDYFIESDFPLTITQEIENRRYRIIRAVGDINGGGDLIRLRTGGGNIYIKKTVQ